MIKIKKNNIWKIILIITAGALIIGGAIFGIVYATSQSKNKYSSENPSGIKFISERSFSLRFEGANKSLLGTGWLMAQDAVNSNIYYLGTNLHVASAINNMNKRPTFDYSGSVQEQTIYQYLSFGQITSIFEDDYQVGVVPNAKSYDTNYFSRLDIQYANVAFTTFDIFNKMNYVDPYKIYNQDIIQNATMDFAVISIDVSHIEDNPNITPPGNLSNITQRPMQKALDQFKKEPTKFASGFIKNQAITVGGFPASSDQGKWKTAINIYSNQNYYGLILDRRNWNPRPTVDNETLKKDYPLIVDIKYITDNYACQRNVANQVLFSNLNLAGGSSGSMAINDKNEVVGIYWGTYVTSDSKEIGTIDLFRSYSQDVVKTKINDYTNKEQEYIVSKPYDIINSFNMAFNTNLR